MRTAQVVPLLAALSCLLVVTQWTVYSSVATGTRHPSATTYFKPGMSVPMGDDGEFLAGSAELNDITKHSAGSAELNHVTRNSAGSAELNGVTRTSHVGLCVGIAVDDPCMVEHVSPPEIITPMTPFPVRQLPSQDTHTCQDADTRCGEWASRRPTSECVSNPGYMRKSCAKSCGACASSRPRTDLYLINTSTLLVGVEPCGTIALLRPHALRREDFSYTMPRPASPGGGHGGGGSEAWAAYILQNSTQHVHL